MQLLSVSFFLFWMITIVCYYLMRRAQWVVLLFASLIGFFLLSGGLPLIILSETAVVYLYGRFSLRSQISRKRGLFVSVGVLALLLIVFRHVLSDFLVGDFNGFFPLLGVSFYTMTAIAYCADVSMKKRTPEKNPAKLLLMLVYFPSILQGPIHRYEQISSELFASHSFSLDHMIMGGLRALFGLMKKLVIVPRLLVYTDAVFGNPDEATVFGLISGTIVFFIELYADWSGYMDIVLGISETFGIRMAENFRRPFFAVSISDVWKRWHITLSRWFRDYIYIPLGGNRKGMIRTIMNVFAVWILTALWHGVSGGYLMWGLYFAILSTVGIFLRKYAIMKSRVKTGVRWMAVHIPVTWLLTAAGFFFFAAGSFSNISLLLSGALAHEGVGIQSSLTTWVNLNDSFETVVLCVGLVLWFFVSFAEEKGMEVRSRLMRSPLPIRWAMVLLLIFYVILCGMYGQQYDAGAFLYQGF